MDNLKPSIALIYKLKKAIRVKSEESEEEIEDLVKAAVNDMKIKGVVAKEESDPLTYQAIKLYCKAHYGYDKDTERFQKAYESLRDSMALSGEYNG